MKTIRTPKGKRISVAQYLALQRAQSARTAGAGPCCEHSHFDCAAWEGGPCGDELASGIEAQDDSDVTVTVDADGVETFFVRRA